MTTRTLPAFTADEQRRAHYLLATCVAQMMGRKFEEGDWSSVYCRAKGIPLAGWSNLNIDVMHDGLGVEHKMLCCKAKRPMLEECGTMPLHPAITRSIRIPSTEVDADEAMRDILGQYAELIAARRRKVQEAFGGKDPDMRMGLLLWQTSLREFLYFEEPMEPPDPDGYYATWNARRSGSARKGSKNLWIYERATNLKRYSVTTEAGAKIQGYFTIPPPDDPNLYHFVVQGESLEAGFVRIWLTVATVHELRRILGSLDTAVVSAAILEAAVIAKARAPVDDNGEEIAVAVLITADAYRALVSAFEGVSDEHSAQLLLRALREINSGE